MSWEAPTFVGGAPVESYELRYRWSSQSLQGRQVLALVGVLPAAPLTATSTTLTGLVTGLSSARAKTIGHRD